MTSFRLAVVGVVTALLTGVMVGLPGMASAVQASQPTLVSPVPQTNTPDVNDGTVYAIGQVGGTMFLGGNFTSVSPHANPGVANTHNNIVAFNASSGAIDNSGFLPAVNGTVTSIIPGPAANQVYVAGSFTQVNGKAMRVALLNATTGQLVAGWAPPTINSAVNKVVLAGGRLFAGGTFTKVGAQTHDGLVALNPATGAVTNYVGSDLNFTGHHNYGTQCDPSGGGCANGGVGVKSLDITPDGSKMAVVGNFIDVSGSARDQAAVVDLGAGSASLDSWQTQGYTASCFSWAFDSYIRDVQFAPNGNYFVIVATGGSGNNSDGSNSLCDTAARFETSDTGSGVQPTWVDYTGQDSLWTVAVTGTAVYVGGHERWLNNSHGFDFAGAGAVPRPGIAALSPTSGVPFSWNPGRNPRGAGCYALLATSTGLWEGSDTDYIGNRLYQHKKVAFFPLTGGETVPAATTPSLPGRVYTAGGFANTANSNVLYRVNAAGPTIGATDDGPDWQGDQNDPSPYRNSGSNAAGWDPVANIDNTVPATTPSGIFSSERWSAQHWEFPVPAGDQVDVRLYFANRYGGTSNPGDRVFDVAIDGQTFLDHYDIVADAGDQTGHMEDEHVTSNGLVTIDLSAEVENPLIDGIEIVKDSAPTNFPTPIYRIHSGGGQINATDGTPSDWLADDNDTAANGTAFRTGGNVANWGQPWGGTENSSVNSAAVPNDVFSTERWAPHTYKFPVPPGTPVKVHLLMANNCGCTDQPGTRQFNVSINGTQVLGPNYDIVADTGGTQIGEDKSFTATATNSGYVTVDLTNGDADNAVINGVEVDQTGPTPTSGGATDIDRFSYRHFDGTTAGNEQPMSTGIAWHQTRGGFMVNGELIYAKGDGNLYERTFDGSTFGSEVQIDPYSGGYWQNVDTGSGQTYQGVRSGLADEMSSISSMFFQNGRLFYTLGGDSAMHWRWFEPESGIVGSDEFTVNDADGDPHDWSGVAGAFLSPNDNTLYFADKSSGVLSKVGWNGTRATGASTVVNTSQDWAARSLFMLADATNPNKVPVASYTATCSATNNDCTFDASASKDPDGGITGFDWTFGDGTGEHHADGSVFTHHFPNAGKFTVTLTVTDNDGATGQKAQQLTVGQSTPVPTFVGAQSACGPTGGTGGCGTTVSRTDVGVPNGTASGDALLLFVSVPSAPGTTASVPSGWHLLGTNPNGALETDVYYRAATNGDPGTTIPVTFSAKTRNSVTLASYHGADANTIEAFAKSTDSSTSSHTAPAATVSTDGSLAVSYWSDKGSTTAWTLPGTVTGRATQIGAGSAGWTSAALADSGSTVNSGSYGSKTATTNVASGKGAMWTIILAPLGSASSAPAAAFTSNCTNLHCTFDASSSTGNGLSYAWNFGDTANNSGTGVTTSHDYTAAGPHTVTLTVTDSNNVTNSVSHQVNPSTAPAGIGFVGADKFDGSATSGTVTIPAATASGDTLLLFASENTTAQTPSAPAGWTQVGTTTTTSNLSSAVFQRPATASDHGTPVTVTFGANAAKGSVMVADYSNVSATPIEAQASATSVSTKNHTAPALSGLTAGTWVVSWWTDKSTTTTAWTPPAAVTKRADVYGTAGGAVSALLADSNAGVSGSYPAQTATTDVASGSAAQWSIALKPSS